jgi:hypothetical protein
VGRRDQSYDGEAERDDPRTRPSQLRRLRHVPSPI